jgi:nucleoside-diphosphate-sugar epimerase
MTYEFPNLHGKRMLVTGATGFSGGHLARRLLELGYQTAILARKTSNSSVLEDFKKRGAEIVWGDVRDRDAVFKACESRDIVFHLAALYREAKHPDSAYFDVNLEGTRNVLDGAIAAKVKRVVHTSTTGVHGGIKDPPADESEGYRPGDVYQRSKCEAEKLALEYFRGGKIDGVVIRPAMIFGEGDARFLKLYKGIHHRRFPIIGSGKVWTHWIYIADLVDAFMLAADRPNASGQIYLIAGRRPLYLSEAVETIARVAGTKPLPFKIPAWPVQTLGSIVEKICVPLGVEPPIHRRRADFFVKHRCFKTTKAETELGFRPSFEFEEEARRVYSWYKEQGWLE